MCLHFNNISYDWRYIFLDSANRFLLCVEAWMAKTQDSSAFQSSHACAVDAAAISFPPTNFLLVKYFSNNSSYGGIYLSNKSMCNATILRLCLRRGNCNWSPSSMSWPLPIRMGPSECVATVATVIVDDITLVFTGGVDVRSGSSSMPSASTENTSKHSNGPGGSGRRPKLPLPLNLTGSCVSSSTSAQSSSSS